MWFTGFQAAILADTNVNGYGTQLLKIWGNTFEFTYSALKWNRSSNATNLFLDMHDNMIDIGAFNWALKSDGTNLYPYSVDLNQVYSAKIFDNFFWGDGRGIRCIDCADLDVHNNDFTYMPNTLLSDSPVQYGYQNLSLSGTGTGNARRQNIHDNHFSSSNSEAVDIVGNVAATFYHNQYTTSSANGNTEPYMAITATNGANTLGINNEWIDASASPAISVASASLAAGSIISDNYFAAGVTPFSISGTLPAGSCIATRSLDACTPGSVSLGAGPSTQGVLNIANNAPVAARNAENTADVALIFLDGLDRVHLGYTWGNNPALTFLDGALSYQNVVGVQYLVSHYSSIQAAINAAYGSGVVSGVVVDDRTSAYTGGGFNVPDSVTVQLAPVTYTINSTVSFNNGNNNVTAGIIVQPGARLIGQGTSSNHGTILQPANSLNADLIASSTVGTGTGTSVQWWHWGEVGNLRIVGNGANQSSGDCLKIENMGETARVHDIELSGCYLNNVELIGASATQSAVKDITTNRSTNGSGVAFTNLSGVAVLDGISGDCNQVSLISSNQNSAGTLEITGLKAEGESSICSGAVQDPVILSTTTSGTVAASIKVDGGYAFGTSQVNFLKSTGPGTIQFTLNNFYLNGYTNILNDTVRGAVIANAATTTKQPVSYLSNGMIFGNQAFTLEPNTFMQGNPNGTPTEIFGLGSDFSTDIAAAGNGDNTKYFTGGVKFGTFNRTMFGQSPEFQARMGWRWTNPGYDTNTWTFVPVWATGDTSVRWIGDPNQRWPEVYAADVNSTTATVGTLNVTTCIGCGPHLVSGSMQGNTATLTGNSADQTLYSATLPAGTFTVGTGAHCWAKWQHTTSGSTAITYKWTLGATTVAYAAFTSASQSVGSDIEVLTPSALTSQIINASAVIAGNGFQAGQSFGNAGSENLANSDTLKLTFNAGSGEQVKGMSFYCQTVQ